METDEGPVNSTLAADQGNKNKTMQSSKPQGTISKIEHANQQNNKMVAPVIRENMFEKFQPWVLSTYGDSAKTKTITRRKALRIVALLSSGRDGLEPAGSEAAKFRLWVKSKGLQLSPEYDHKIKEGAENLDEEPYLIVPSGTDKTVDGKVHFVYKKVAVVENFFDIIYSVHVESAGDTQLRGRAGKHCGQKRTYRAVADQYAFIPREAVSKFLLYCTQCQRKVSSHQSQGSSGPAVNLANQGTISTQPNQSTLSTLPNQGTPTTLPNQEEESMCISNTRSDQIQQMDQSNHNLTPGNMNSQSVNMNHNQLLASPHLITSLASPHLVTNIASPHLAGNLTGGISCVPGSTQHIIQQTENSGNQYFIKVQQNSFGSVKPDISGRSSNIISGPTLSVASSIPSILAGGSGSSPVPGSLSGCISGGIPGSSLNSSLVGGIGSCVPDSSHDQALAYVQAVSALQTLAASGVYHSAPNQSIQYPGPPHPYATIPFPTSTQSPIHPFGLVGGAALYTNPSIFPPSPSPDNLEIDLTLPITSTYLKRFKGREQYISNHEDRHINFIKKEENESTEDNGMDTTNTSLSGWRPTPVNTFTTANSHSAGIQTSLSMAAGPQNTTTETASVGVATVNHIGQYLTNHNGQIMSGGDGSIHEDTGKDDTSSLGNKEEDEDEEEDDINDDKFENSGDPERLKAFNMFVRLFVDENLDRHVPISKQPKEKIQAIIDSCTRQFPEYSDRARKRIRTYLKSCRRTKRSREQAGLDTNNRPTPPHLTSVQAEQMLARACENEAENAKRMRMGMEPVSQPLPIPMSYSAPMDMITGLPGSGVGSPLTLTVTMDKTKMEYKPEHLATLLSTGAAGGNPGGGIPVSVNGTPATVQYRQVLQAQPQQPQPPQQQHQQQPQQQQQLPLTVYTQPQPPTPQPPTLNNGIGMVPTNGQIDAVKKAGPLLNHKLNGTEMAAVRQLITGYRESAAFLLRSADELEHLVQMQQKI